MDNNEVLGHLLKVEAEAALLVNEAQAEADKRVAEAEKQNRAAYDESYRVESGKLEGKFQQSKELTRQRYREELEAYKRNISSVGVDTGRFAALLDRFFEEGA